MGGGGCQAAANSLLSKRWSYFKKQITTHVVMHTVCCVYHVIIPW